jgi:hypothetical protein
LFQITHEFQLEIQTITDDEIDTYDLFSERTKSIIATLVDRRSINRYGAIGAIWEPLHHRHSSSSTHTMPQQSELFQSLLISESDDVIGHNLVVVVWVVVTCCMITHFDEVAVAFTLDCLH